MEKKKNNGIQILVIVAIIVLVFIVAVDVVLNYVPLKEIFKTNTNAVNNITKKEVTVTDEGIADAVEKLYDATVIVKVGKNNNQISGWGSGFVYKKDNKYGYILTNHHVIDGASMIQIEFSNGVNVKGTLLGSDEYADVAVVRVNVDKILAVAEIGETSSLRVGDTVFAVGTPVSLDYSFTVTRGILSGKDRLVESTHEQEGNGFNFFNQNTVSDSWYMRLLQIDASINSGNSGGPLANCNGEVIGITNSKLSSSSYTNTASIENIGFAIPIEDALDVAKLVEKGKTTSSEKAKLGVSMTSVDGASANKIDLDDSITYGAVVVEVQDNSNASRAGLKSGDVVIKYNDYKIQDYRYLKYYLYKSNIGDKVKLTYIRNGKERTTEVTLKK